MKMYEQINAGLKVAVKHARRRDAGVLVGDHLQGIDRLAFHIVADFEKLCDGVATAVVDKDLAGTHYDNLRGRLLLLMSLEAWIEESMGCLISCAGVVE